MSSSTHGTESSPSRPQNEWPLAPPLTTGHAPSITVFVQVVLPHSGGGSLAYKEMRQILSGSISAPKKKVVLSGEGSLSDQLADALKANAGRVLDLFRSWDTNGDGQVSRAEFHKAIPALGLEVPKSDVDALFDTWDNDGGGSLAYKELKKILGGPPSPAFAAAKAAEATKAVQSAVTVAKAATSLKALKKTTVTT